MKRLTLDNQKWNYEYLVDNEKSNLRFQKVKVKWNDGSEGVYDVVWRNKEVGFQGGRDVEKLLYIKRKMNGVFFEFDLCNYLNELEVYVVNEEVENNIENISQYSTIGDIEKFLHNHNINEIQNQALRQYIKNFLIGNIKYCDIVGSDEWEKSKNGIELINKDRPAIHFGFSNKQDCIISINNGDPILLTTIGIDFTGTIVESFKILSDDVDYCYGAMYWKDNSWYD